MVRQHNPAGLFEQSSVSSAGKPVNAHELGPLTGFNFTGEGGGGGSNEISEVGRKRKKRRYLIPLFAPVEAQQKMRVRRQLLLWPCGPGGALNGAYVDRNDGFAGPQHRAALAETRSGGGRRRHAAVRPGSGVVAT